MTQPQGSYIYLASPYSHPDAAVSHHRFLEARRAVVWLMRHHDWVFSPIVHNHELAKLAGMPTDALFWRMYNEVMLTPAERLYLLNIHGLPHSKGVRHEIEVATALKKPIHLLTPHADTYEVSLYHKSPILEVE